MFRPRSYHRDDRTEFLTDDERAELEAGYGCESCLGFGDLANLGPCPDCQPDKATEHLLTVAAAMYETTRNEEHDWEVTA
jgi:hypothetical protein